MLVTELRDRLALIHSPAGVPSALSVPVALASLRHRTPPSPSSLSKWICQRVGEPDLREPLRAQFELALNGRSVPGAPRGLGQPSTYALCVSSSGPRIGEPRRLIESVQRLAPTRASIAIGLSQSRKDSKFSTFWRANTEGRTANLSDRLATQRA